MDAAVTVERSGGADQKIPSLDGLRAVSILLVLLGHLSGTRGFGPLDMGIGDYAHLGVVVFFVISGFLITSLLMSEQEKAGSVSLKRFYARRALRLFPPAYVYLAVLGLLSAAGLVELHAKDVWPCGAVHHKLSAGTLVGGGPFVVAVRGRAVLSALAGSFCAAGIKEFGLGPVGAILAGPVSRAVVWYFWRKTPYSDLEYFPVVADSIAMGCLLARTRGWLEEQTWYMRPFRPAWSLALVAIALGTNRFMNRTVIWVFGTSLVHLCIAILIHRSVYSSGRDPVGKVLNWRPVAWIGTLSYSLYVWQQLFLNRNSSAWINTFPQNLALAVAAALGSYYLL